MEPSHVLVPLDGSPLADDALAHALATFDCPVTVLNVVTPLDSPMSEGGIIGVDESREDAAHDRAENLVADAKRRVEGAGQRVDTAVEAGDPAETILAYVDAHEVDHVVMGGHGGDRNALSRRLLGTVASTVVGDSPVPVTVIK
ncbi:MULTISPECIES: universal stress protein [Haloferax]|uniref:Universal stress protein n=1 Tax=Haloferax marinum TaxID=2666143 RepID=A0A6A8G987_9EURY|nr:MULTISPECIES: universal stress protein [Haloferax]KAB1198684.1 universal stress protein [Haloferax sp. CBA1150]MRW97800.1 universal stress protein [Haloferax marinum]